MKKVFKVLEFDKILAKLCEYTESEAVQKKIKEMDMLTAEEAKNAQKETTQAVSAMLRRGNPPVNLSVENITGIIKRVQLGAILNPKELLAVARVMYVSRRMKTYLGDAGADLDIIYGLSSGLTVNKSLEDKIGGAVLSENEIADDASAVLSALRRKQKNLNAKIKENLNSMIRSEHYKKYLQDAIVTMRQDRYVIPVKAEYKQEINGIVHDTSSSGSTLFIEPMSVVSANNEIRALQNQEEQEIQKILAELTAAVAEHESGIESNYKIITELDFIFCKGKLSLDYNGNEPELNDKGIIEFHKARHPLIDKNKVVANDIFLGDKFDTLVITGPNTGGKTVTLKTIGLFSVMAAAGLHLPVGDSSKAAVFSGIFADIGDEQSIEQSLSTFSSHMVNIVDIVKQVDDNSLALFDELGAGTDPTEGAALAISILEYLKTFKVKTAATTHYSELKLYALSTDRVENASCEFNVETLNPTYRLMIGVPGKSNAFAISRRLGLDEVIIDRANELLSDEDVKFEDVITDLEESRAKAHSEMEYAQRMKREIKDLRGQLETERKKIKENKSRILEEARREAKIIIMDAREEANSIIKDLQKMQEKGYVKNAGERIEKNREKLKSKEESIDKAMEKSSKPRKVYHELPKNLKPGDAVKIVTMSDQEASVIKPADKNGMVLVQAGIIKMEVHLSNLKKIEDKTAKQLADKYIKSSGEFSVKAVSTTCDVRGQNLEEALMNVEKFLDDCYLAGISPVTVIHGKGTGILKKGIHEMLRKQKYVKSYRLGTFGEGENGVTIVELK
ncbi:MAG: endonuclease MutS2 [Clostridia bacterium]|nr:endonuclease MutS2 [Clostridia bacterium]